MHILLGLCCGLVTARHLLATNSLNCYMYRSSTLSTLLALWLESMLKSLSLITAWTEGHNVFCKVVSQQRQRRQWWYTLHSAPFTLIHQDTSEFWTCECSSSTWKLSSWYPTITLQYVCMCTLLFQLNFPTTFHGISPNGYQMCTTLFLLTINSTHERDVLDNRTTSCMGGACSGMMVLVWLQKVLPEALCCVNIQYVCL